METHNGKNNSKFNKCSCEFTEYQWSHSDNNTIVIHKISSEFFHLIYIDGETVETVSDFIFWGSKSLQMVIAAMKLKDACSLEEKL